MFTGWILAAVISQAVAWASFAACLWIAGVPAWIPSPVTVAALRGMRRSKP